MISLFAKIMTIGGSLVVLTTATAGMAAAQDIAPVCSGDAANTTVCQEVQKQKNKDENPFIRLINIIIDAVSVLAGAFAVVGLLIGSVKLLASNGDAQSVAGARTTILYSLLGIAVIVLAQAIVYFVISKV